MLKALFILVGVSAHKSYVPLIPNSPFPTVPALGHVNHAGGGATNKFGAAFKNNTLTWNSTLACQDSDSDGFPNGWELGDPCGNWTVGSTPTWTNDVSHPGEKASVPLTRKVDWSICKVNPCPA